jgi:hypothetical protein
MAILDMIYVKGQAGAVRVLQGCHCHAAPSQFKGFGCYPKPPRAFVQRIFQLLILPPNPGDHGCFRHAMTIAEF